jgi:hypothetical protein
MLTNQEAQTARCWSTVGVKVAHGTLFPLVVVAEAAAEGHTGTSVVSGRVPVTLVVGVGAGVGTAGLLVRTGVAVAVPVTDRLVRHTLGRRQRTLELRLRAAVRFVHAGAVVERTVAEGITSIRLLVPAGGTPQGIVPVQQSTRFIPVRTLAILSCPTDTVRTLDRSQPKYGVSRYRVRHESRVDPAL